MNKELSTTGHDRDSPDYFIGRNELLQDYFECIATTPAFVGVIYGHSGVGKTAFANRLVEKANSEEDSSIEALFFEVQAAQNAEEPLLALYGRMLKVVRPRGVNRFREALNDNAVTNGFRLVGGVARDMFARFAVDFHHTANAVTEITCDATSLVSEKSFCRQVGNSNYSELIDALRAAASQTSKVFVLVRDSVETASERCVQLLDSTSSRLPANIRLQLIVNSEDPAFSRKDFVNLTAHLQHRHARGIRELEGLTSKEIIEWKQLVAGVYISDALAEEARAKSDGRPIMLKPWIASADADLSRIEEEGIRFYKYYEERFGRLDRESQQIGQIPAVAHPHVMKLPLLEVVSHLPDRQVGVSLQALMANGFCEEVRNAFRCKHAIVAGFFLTAKGLTE